MTVPDSKPVSGPILTDGVKTLFDFTFKIFDPSHIALFITDLNDLNPREVDVGLTVDPQYLGQDTGGYVSYMESGAPLPAGYKVYPYRIVPYTQPNRIGNQGPFAPETHERTFDLLEMQIQQLLDRVQASIKTQIGFQGDATIFPEAGTVLGWVNGNLENVDPSELIASALAGALLRNAIELILPTLPTVPPALPYKLWNNGGTLSFTTP